MWKHCVKLRLTAFVAVMVKFPLMFRTLVATGVHRFSGRLTLVLISRQYVVQEKPLVPFITRFVPDKLMPAKSGGCSSTTGVTLTSARQGSSHPHLAFPMG
jgi:hypothetical protein